jgi:uncharacterized protein (TIGR00251 family)
MIKETPEGLIISIKVTPKSSKNEIVGWENEELKVRITAAPEKGEANEEVIRFLSKTLGIAKSRVILLSGETSRHKKILLKDMKLDNISLPVGLVLRCKGKSKGTI